MRNRGSTPLDLTLVGFLTWLIIGLGGVAAELQQHSLATPRALLWLLCFASFIVLFRWATKPETSGRRELLLIAAESLLALACIALQPSAFQAVLLVIIAGQLGRQPLRLSFSWVAVQTIALAAVLGRFRDDAIFVALAYFAFQLFGVFTAHIARREEEARQALGETNAQLMVTAGMLEINSRTSERLRIARDLHDLIGHHLAALSLNLEVASHLSDSPAREQIEKSKRIASALLTDVRDVVSRLRDDEPIDLTAALRSIREAVTSPSLHVQNTDAVVVSDAAVAQVALRVIQEIVTNAVRHSAARNLWVRLETGDGLQIEARDDGVGTDRVLFGNGLRGMRERIEALKGTLEITSMRGHGFSLRVRLPQETAA